MKPLRDMFREKKRRWMKTEFSTITTYESKHKIKSK